MHFSLVYYVSFYVWEGRHSFLVWRRMCTFIAVYRAGGIGWPLITVFRELFCVPTS